MKTATALALAAALAVAGCGDPDDTSSRSIPGRVTPPGGGVADSPLPTPAVVLLGELTSPQMRAPRRLAVQPNGDIVVSDPGASKVHVFTPNGALKSSIRLPGAAGVTVDGAGLIYAGERITGSVKIFNVNGGLVGELGVGAGQFVNPDDLAWDRTDGTILVVDTGAHKVSVFSVGGAHLFDYGTVGTGDGQFRVPTGIEVDHAGGRIFVADSGNARIQVFDRAGGFAAKFGSYGSKHGELNQPRGLILDTTGRLYIADAYQSTLQVLDTDGFFVSYVGEPGANYGQLRLSMDAVIDPFDRLLVTSYKSGKVLIYGIDDYRQPPPDAVQHTARVVLQPPTINGRSPGGWLFAQISLTDADVRHVIVDSVYLQGVQRAGGAPVTYDDTNGDGVEDLVLRFARADLVDALPGAGTHQVTLVGDLTTGDTLRGTAVVDVLAGEP